MFRRFLSYACEHSTSFSLTHNRQLIYQAEKSQTGFFLKQLAPYKIRSIQSSHWFHMYTKKSDPIFVDLFHLNDITAKIISDVYSDLYLGYYSDCAWMPEDICFFWNDRLWLGTVSHEDWCTVFPQNLQMEESLRQFGTWDVSEPDAVSEWLDLKDFL